VIVFGSFARGDADAASDIDVVIVRPSSVDEDDDTWVDSLDEWRHAVRRASGNPVEVLEISVDDAASKLESRSQAWSDIRRDGIVVYGLGLDELRAPRVG
jgi:predicted nucleotidyltransferase